MNTLNAVIYHCHACGRVVHAEPNAEPPQCCDHAMVKSCEETIHEGDVAEKTVAGPAEAAPPPSEDIEKTR